MKFGSLFAGIRGFDLALTRAGMASAYAVEIDDKCNSVARRHFPEETQFDDVTTFRGRRFSGRIDLLCAGWPCQGNSVAGRRAGMADSRSGLWGEVARIIAGQRPRWFLGENVPGLLSVNGGRDFGAILGDLAALGYGFAYRILDAQRFGLAQRRRRVFIVGCLGNWQRPAEVLFERESLPWDSPKGRETGADVAYCIAAGAGGSKFGSGRDGQDTLIPFDTTQVTNKNNRSTCEPGGPCHTLPAAGHAPAIAFSPTDYRTGQYGEVEQAGPLTCSTDQSRATPIVAYSIQGANSNAKANHALATDVARCLDGSNPAANQGGTVVAYQCHGSNVGGMGVRRLTPVECERLQGFPDGWTERGADGAEIADGARYKMLGNAVAVPVVEWIGRRIMANERMHDASFVEESR